MKSIWDYLKQTDSSTNLQEMMDSNIEDKEGLIQIMKDLNNSISHFLIKGKDNIAEYQRKIDEYNRFSRLQSIVQGHIRDLLNERK